VDNLCQTFARIVHHLLMPRPLKKIGRSLADRLSSHDERTRRRWQAITGVVFMLVFVVSSIAVNRVVLALNQAAGNYGYVSGSYGYQNSASSDYIPSAPTSLASSVSGTSVTLNWIKPTTTTGSTSVDNFNQYLVHYDTSSLSTCSGGTQVTTTSTSTALSSLTAGTTYYVAVCSQDTNSNSSDAVTGSFTTASASSGGGGGGSAGGGSGSSISSTPSTTTTATTTVAPAVSSTTGKTSVATVAAPTVANKTAILAAIGETFSAAKETTGTSLLQKALGSSTVASLGSAVREAIVTYVSYGNSAETKRLGAGERASTVENFSRIFGATPTGDTDFQALHAMVLGDDGKPVADIKKIRRAEFAESDFLAEFHRLNGHFPCAATDDQALCDSEWLSLEIMTYGYKPLNRNLDLERTAIRGFKAISYVEDFKGTRVTKAKGVNPSAIGHWNAIRSCVYGNPQTCPLLQ
jgi:hypothetical protein